MLDDKEAAKLLWDEWKYRHSIFWNSLYRWGIAVVTISLVPYVKTDIIETLGLLVLAFPVVSALFSIVAAWHLAAEYYRLQLVRRRYLELLAPYTPYAATKTLLAWSIGSAVTYVFLYGLTSLSLINAYLLLERAGPPVN